MEKQSTQLTRINLQCLGLSKYLVSEILKELEPVLKQGSYKYYSDSQIIAGIEKKLTNSRLKDTTRNQLQKVLKKLKTENNVINVDFLRKLSPADKVSVLKDKLKELELQEQNLTKETIDLLQKAELALRQ